MALAGFSIRHERAILFLLGVLVLLGAWSYTQTRAAIFPEMRFSRVDVVATAGNLPPEQMHVSVGLPLERAFLGLPFAQRVITTAAQGSAELVVQFDPKTDVQLDLEYVNAAISRVRAQLPLGTDVQANIIIPQSEPILSYAFTSPLLSQTLMSEYAQQRVLPTLYGAPGLARVLVIGGPQREYHVELDPAALASAKLIAGDVVNAIAAANDVEAVGISQQYSQRSALLVDAGLRDASQLQRIVVPTAQGPGVTVGSLGSVTLGVAPESVQTSYDATHAVSMNVYALPGADAVRLADEVKARMRSIAAALPRGMEVHTYWDATDIIVASQASLRDAILIGALLAIGVIFFFLRNLRITMVAALVIPAAMAIAVLGARLFGESLNIMSLGALAIAVGLIIDDAIVVVEGIAHRLHEAPSSSVPEAVVAAMRRLIGPMTASTLTTVVVFAPLSLLSGVAGSFFRALALTLTCALVVSLALALFVTPTLFRRLLATHEPRSESSGIAHVLDRYEPILRWALDRRRSVYVMAGVVLAATAALLLTLPTDFLPRLDEGQFEVAYRMPVGTTLAASDAAAMTIEQVVLADPAVTSVGRVTGIDTNGFSPTPARTGTIRVRLKPLGRRASFERIAERLRVAIGAAVPAAQLDIHQILEDMINDVSGAPAPIEIVVSGADQATLVRAATRVANDISRVRGVADAFSGVEQDDPTLRVQPDFARLARLGVNTPGLAQALAASAQGSVATQLPESTMLVPVRVAMAGAAGSNGSVPDAVTLPGGSIPFTQVSGTIVDRSATDVTDINGLRSMRVTANVGGRSLSSIVSDLRRAILAAKLPPGYTAQIEGAYQAQQASFREFGMVFVIAIVLVFFVMLTAFHSFRQPLVILMAVPLAPIGVALGLVLTRTPFNVSSFMGLLLLIGLVVKNGILLIDAANRRRREGAEVTQALVLAGRERLRPILMTAFATIGGLLPLAFGIGAGAAMERPLAIAVVGGLSTATFFTLILIPVLYAAFCSTEEPAI
ncbi:MAG TPA: efflux RND transporter permease subunit [Candidatus Tyrphobacter sp.]